MDPAHGPFVHQAWWWRSRASIREKTKRFEPIPEGFRMSAHAPSGNSAPYKLCLLYTSCCDLVFNSAGLELLACQEFYVYHCQQSFKAIHLRDSLRIVKLERYEALWIVPRDFRCFL